MSVEGIAEKAKPIKVPCGWLRKILGLLKDTSSMPGPADHYLIDPEVSGDANDVVKRCLGFCANDGCALRNLRNRPGQEVFPPVI